MRTLVTGAAGMLGSDLCDVLAAAGHDVVALARADADITDAGALRERVLAERPDAVVNCAAYTNVDGAEAEEEAAAEVNERGAGNVAAAAAAAGASVVYVSSDYVFDGRKGATYVESDPTGPLGAYGRTKLAGEVATAAAAPEAHAIVRSSWLFGTRGRNFVETMLGLAESRDAVSVVDDQVGCPTYTRHLAEGLVRVVEDGTRGVVHLAGAGACSWRDFAEEIFEQAAAGCRADPWTTAQAGRPAPRPAYSALASERDGVPRLPDWRAGLAAYLAERSGARPTTATKGAT
jgi:dTDP-4-dehydrorhamnose reductase